MRSVESERRLRQCINEPAKVSGVTTSIKEVCSLNTLSPTLLIRVHWHDRLRQQSVTHGELTALQATVQEHKTGQMQTVH